jgi:hypothetical protein
MCVCFKADLGDVAQEHFGGLDAPEAHYDTGAPARLRELHARGVHPHPLAAHVRRPPLARARFTLHRAACHARVLDRPRGSAMRATRGYSAASRRALSSSGSDACFGADGTSPADWSAERRSLRRTVMSRIVVAEM